VNKGTLILTFDFKSTEPQPRVEVGDSSSIMRKLLEKGVSYFKFIGLPPNLDSVSARNQYGAHVPVEEDADFLLQHYEQIESAFSLGSPCELFLFLGDGAIELNSRISQGRVIIEVISCPGLRKDKAATETMNVGRDEFLLGWRRVAWEIIEASRDCRRDASPPHHQK